MTSTNLHDKYSNYHYCIVRECKNTSIKTPGKLWIKVPTEANMRNTWLRLAQRDPESLSTANKIYFCEDHFDIKTPNCDLTPSSPSDPDGQRKEDDVPKAFPDFTATPCDVKACRLCLATHRLRRMTDRARRAYGLLTGLTPPNDGHLPPYVCVTCAHRVKSFVRFRTDCLRTQLTVLEAIKKYKQVTLESIKSVAGERRLGSHLSVTHNQTDRYDLQIVHDETQGAPVDYDGLLKPHAIVKRRPRAHDEEQDTPSDGDRMPGGDAALYLTTADDEALTAIDSEDMASRDVIVYQPTAPDNVADCDVKVKLEEMDCEDFLDYEYTVDETNNGIDISEVKIELESDAMYETEGDDESDRPIFKRFKSIDNVDNTFDTNKAYVPHGRMAVTNSTMNIVKCKDKVVTNDLKHKNDPKECIAIVRKLPEVDHISTNKDGMVPGNTKPAVR